MKNILQIPKTSLAGASVLLASVFWLAPTASAAASDITYWIEPC